jgi:hypothetical protein
MAMGELEVIDGASAGAWIEPRLRGRFGAVGIHVPRGYAAYARICHPPTDEAGRRVRWSDVADATGRRAHPTMQWHALVGSPDSLNFTGSLWAGEPPESGNLAPDLLASLCRAVNAGTTDPGHCLFALWVGWGWVEDGAIQIRFRPRGAGARSVPAAQPVERLPPAFSPEELSRPRLKLPGREYIVLRGPPSAATQFGDPEALRGLQPQSPNLIWPEDRAWFVASEIDFDSTLVGGPADLIQAVLDTPELDAWPVAPDDSLACDADRVNTLAEPNDHPTDAS